MAQHTQLPIYRAAYTLLDSVTDMVKNMPRDFKRSIGEKISVECIEIMVLVFRANVATDKSPHLTELLERQQVIELLLRLCVDKRLISRPAYAGAIEQTTSIGKQANGWKSSSAKRPLRQG
ncbi:four helix bundle protein [Pandoraea communis]|uniref:Four helix bundle protein n=1 Tax=Pandoraea communis TaxID=2508297 RepID=A0A5E4TTM6_9BURK|nr:four helix bundle protein [Pandoraea communis]VVD91286.1 four helix bundle protein [Pandoraea communis]